MKPRSSAIMALAVTLWFFLTSILRYFHVLARVFYSSPFLSNLIIAADIFYAIGMIVFFLNLQGEKRLAKLRKWILPVIIFLIVFLVFSILHKIPSLWQHTIILMQYPFLKFISLLITIFLFFFWLDLSSLKIDPLLKFTCLLAICISAWNMMSLLLQILGRLFNVINPDSEFLILSRPVFLFTQIIFILAFIFTYHKKKPRKQTKRSSK